MSRPKYSQLWEMYLELKERVWELEKINKSLKERVLADCTSVKHVGPKKSRSQSKGKGW